MFINDPFFVFGILTTIIVFILVVMMTRTRKSQLVAMRDWIYREQWTGNLITVPLESWRRTGTKYGDGFIYDLYFYLDVNKSKKKYFAKGIVNPNDIHKLKKGLGLIIKYSDNTPSNIAVMYIDF
ncbi:hypothetical protein [Serratia rubidaea]|uniref:DUF3592 domain-containing protein n=1 Tax=Serratia rubidaea TaxID=61652 RepID=A0ABS0MHJ3_SERRU|nr:hypothetical protein [Serratia rubidaea]MBH1931802.1 hypothetical protein [Serratia rubidaea]